MDIIDNKDLSGILGFIENEVSDKSPAKSPIKMIPVQKSNEEVLS